MPTPDISHPWIGRTLISIAKESIETGFPVRYRPAIGNRVSGLKAVKAAVEKIRRLRKPTVVVGYADISALALEQPCTHAVRVTDWVESVPELSEIGITRVRENPCAPLGPAAAGAVCGLTAEVVRRAVVARALASAVGAPCPVCHPLIPARLARQGTDAAFLRLLRGILAALRLLLVVLLTALARAADLLTFVLIVIAVRRRFGHRHEPSDGHPPFVRRYRPSARRGLAIS
ncbi:MAG: hypothetical protein ACRDP6_05435 [Actinoallomurus sp.]